MLTLAQAEALKPGDKVKIAFCFDGVNTEYWHYTVCNPGDFSAVGGIPNIVQYLNDGPFFTVGYIFSTDFHRYSLV